MAYEGLGMNPPALGFPHKAQSKEIVCAYDHICTIGDPFPVRAGEPCCEVCTDYRLDDTASVEQLGMLIQGSIQRRGGPYLGALVVEGVAADVLASLGRPTPGLTVNECPACGLVDALNNEWRQCRRCGQSDLAADSI